MSRRDAAICARIDRRAAREARRQRAAELKAPPPTWSFTFWQALKVGGALIAAAAVYGYVF